MNLSQKTTLTVVTECVLLNGRHVRFVMQKICLVDVENCAFLVSSQILILTLFPTSDDMIPVSPHFLTRDYILIHHELFVCMFSLLEAIQLSQFTDNAIVTCIEQ